MTDHNVSTLGDKKGEHWVIHAHVFPVHVEKGELNIYSSKHIAKMEENLTKRAKSTQSIMQMRTRMRTQTETQTQMQT